MPEPLLSRCLGPPVRSCPYDARSSRDQHDLAHVQRLDLREDRSRWPGTLFATKRWNRTEPTPSIAAFGNFDVGPRRECWWPRQLQQIEALRQPVCRGGSRSGSHDALSGLHLDGHAEARDKVNLAERVRKLFSRALGQTPRDDEPRPELALGVELEDRLDRLLARGIYEGAGVNDNKISIAGIFYALVAARG